MSANKCASKKIALAVVQGMSGRASGGMAKWATHTFPHLCPFVNICCIPPPCVMYLPCYFHGNLCRYTLQVQATCVHQSSSHNGVSKVFPSRAPSCPEGSALLVLVLVLICCRLQLPACLQDGQEHLPADGAKPAHTTRAHRQCCGHQPVVRPVRLWNRVDA